MLCLCLFFYFILFFFLQQLRHAEWRAWVSSDEQWAVWYTCPVAIYIELHWQGYQKPLSSRVAWKREMREAEEEKGRGEHKITLFYYIRCNFNKTEPLSHPIPFSTVSTTKKTSTDGHSLKWHFISLYFPKSLHLRGKICILVAHYRLHHTCLQALSGVFERAACLCACVCVYSIFLNACIAPSSLSLSAILPPPWVTH